MKKVKVKGRFKEYYDALPRSTAKTPKSEFIDEIAELCCVTTQTVRFWLCGVQRPDALKTKLIAEKMGVSPDELFA